MKSDDVANAALIERFYNAFSRRDPDAMLACYHRGVTFSDPVFLSLDAAGAASMWRMLCARGKDLVVTTSEIRADASTGSARWVANYTFSASHRKVTNRIAAAFDFKDALIVRHVDRFSLWRWAAMALGPKGARLGWCPPVRAAIRAQAAKGLAAFAKGQP